MKFTRIKRQFRMYRTWTIHPCFAVKGGGPSLKPTDGRKHNWADLNGFFICLPNSSMWFEFRRASR